MDDKPGSFDPRGMPKDSGKPPTSHGQTVLPGGHRLVEGMPPHHIPMYPGSIVPGQFIPYGYRADLGVLAAAAAVREQQMYMGQGGPPRSQEEALMKERMNRERAAQVHQREMERVSAAREMEVSRSALTDPRAREMRDLAAEQAVQEHFEESLRRAAVQANQAKQAQGRGEIHPQTTRAPSYTTTHGLPKAELNFASAFNYHNNPHAAHPSHQAQQQNRTSPVKRDMSPQEVKHQVPPRSASRESEAYAQHPGYVVHSYKNASPGPSQTARGSSPRRSPNLGPPATKPSEKQQYAYPAPSRTPTEAFDPNRMYQDSRRYNSSPNIRQSNSPALIHPPSMPAPRNPSPGLPPTTSYRPSPGITTGIPVFRPAESSIALTTKPAPSPSPLSRSYYPERTPPPSQLPVKHPSPQMEPLDLGKKPSPDESQAKKQKLDSLEVLPPSRMISVAELISSTLDKETPQHPQHSRGLKIIDTDSKGSVLAFTADVKNHISPPKDRLQQQQQQQQHFIYSREQVIREPVVAREPQREPPRDVRDHRDVPREYKDYVREQQREVRSIPCDFRESPRDSVQDREREQHPHPHPSVINTRELPREPVIEVLKKEPAPEKPESPPVKVEVKVEPTVTPPIQPKVEASPVAEQPPPVPEVKTESKEEEPQTPPKVEARSETDSAAPSAPNGPVQPVRKLKAAWLQRMVNNDSVTPSIKPPEQPVKVEPKPEVKVEKEDKNKKVKKGKNGKKSDSSNESEECDKTDKKPLPETSLPVKTTKNPFNKPTVATLKKSGESFLQDSPCYEVAPRLGKCRECRMAPPQKGKKVDVMPNANIFCRFYAFRRLRYTKTGQLAVAGFSDPEKDPHTEDLSLWLPNENAPPSDLDADIATFLLGNVGDQFCKLIQTEKEAAKLQNRDGQPIAWKRVVQGVREMCDVCETTLFNFHWVCGKCGFVACIDCYRSRFSTPGKEGEPENDNKENGSKEKENAKLNGHDSRGWLLCSNRSAHLLDSLMPTQIIAGDALTRISENLHMTRAKLGLPQNCGCPEALKCKTETENTKNGVPEKSSNGPTSEIRPTAFEDKKHPVKPENMGKQEDHEESTIKISQYIHEVLLADTAPTHNGTDSAPPAKRPKLDTLSEGRKGEQKVSHWLSGERTPRIMTNDFSEMLYPKVPHAWECEGRLLRLLDASASGSFEFFQDQWLRGQPVVVAKVGGKLNMNLWTPESFAKDFGHIKNDLVNCWNGNIVPNQPMSKFWEGFEKYSKRLKDEKGQAMLLKLKDWPPGEDFAEMLPSRYEDLMKSLPMGEYTLRSGRCNLAGRLPDCFVRPDLGPKMYNAYGSPLHFSKGTTNLHLDVSDAVNVMVFVGIPKDTPNGEDLLQESFNCMKEEGVDLAMQFRIRKNQDLPGAIWQIYHAKDTDKIRDLLTKVAVEKNQKLTAKSDPIHDQATYLDGPLRERLYREYGVRGYTIVQCMGEAVFIPAGAPHQVRNLHSCIKVAEDFVSPENISKCYQLTQEFRDLSENHTNHEDKLQIKNIIYHAVKDCLAVLNRTDSTES